MSSNLNSQLILNLDTTLRQVLLQPTIDNIQLCFSLIQKCYYRRLEDENSVQDDSLYIPAMLLLRQFPRFQHPSTFDKLLEEFITLFKIMPIRTRKTLDDFICIINIILTKRIMTTNDEVQQDLFIRFFQAFCISIKSTPNLFYKDFLGNFNQNLSILGHLISCLLQLYEKISTLDFRLNILETFWLLIYVNKNEHENEYKVIVGQILACFLPGILKTLVQEISSGHQRLVYVSLILLSYIIRLSIHLSSKYNNESSSIKEELRDIIVERNEQWLSMADTHIAPVLQRLTTSCANHENSDVRQALATLMLTVLCFCSAWLKISASIALKTMLVLVSSKTDDQNQLSMNAVLKKLFKLSLESSSVLTSEHSSSSDSSSLLTYESEFNNEILSSSSMFLSDRLLIECQSDLFQLLDQQQTSSSAIEADRRWRLQFFIGYYSFIHHHIDFLFDMDAFVEKFLRFILNTLDFEALTRTNLNLLHETSLPDNSADFDRVRYDSVYKHFKSDVHSEIQQILSLFISSHPTFTNYLFEQIDKTKIVHETNQKILYLLSVVHQENKLDNFEDYQTVLKLLIQMMCDDNDQQNRKRRRKKSTIKKEEPIAARNLTVYYLLQCIRSIVPIDQFEYLIDYVPLLLLCHSSKYTIIHQTSLYCLKLLADHLSLLLIAQSEYIIDSSLKKLQTSSYDGYLILIEFVRLGKDQVVNLPIMTHVIEQLLLELSCLPPVECIEFTFQFLSVFCQQVFDIVDKKQNIKSTLIHQQPKSLIDFTLELQRQYKPVDTSQEQINDEDEKSNETKHPWHSMLVSIVDVFQHFVSHSNPHIRSYVLDAFPSLAKLLSTIDENLLLPLVHKFWPGLIHRLHDFDFNIRIRCLTTIQCLCHICSDFVDRRIRQDILPILIQYLDRNRLLPSSNKLEYRYLKSLLTNIGSIVNAITITVEDVEKITLILFKYLQVEQLATNAYEQLCILTEKYSDIIWLKLILHDDNEIRKTYFDKMKVYKPEPQISIDAQWKSNLLECLAKC